MSCSDDSDATIEGEAEAEAEGGSDTGLFEFEDEGVFGLRTRLKQPVRLSEQLEKGNSFEVDADYYENTQDERRRVQEGIFQDPEFLKKLQEIGTFSDEEDGDEDDGIFERKKRKMLEVPGSEGLLHKRVLQHGAGPVVPEGALVVFHYKLYCEGQPEPFDASRCHGNGRPTRQRLGHSMIEGINMALASMKKRERAAFVVAPDIFLGELGCAPRIPGGVPIYGEVELIDYIERDGIEDYFCKTQDERQELSCAETLRIVRQCRNDAKSAFEQKRNFPALKKYLRAEDILDMMTVRNEEEDAEKKKELRLVYQNMALIWYRLDRFVSCAKYCDLALQLQANSVKSLYYKGKALTALGEYKRAASTLLQALSLRRDNNDIMQALENNEKRAKVTKELEKAQCRRMFAQPPVEASGDARVDPAKALGAERAEELRARIRKFSECRLRPNMFYPAYAMTHNEREGLKAIVAEFDNLEIEVVGGTSYAINKKSLY